MAQRGLRLVHALTGNTRGHHSSKLI